MSGGQMNEQENPVQDPAEPTEPAMPEPEPSEPTPAPDTTPPGEEDNGGDGEE